jgi:hypothetical protein
MFTSLIPANKADGFDSWMIAQGVDGGNSSMDDIQYTRRKTCKLP